MAFCSIIIGVLAITTGLLLSPIPTRLGFYRWLATRGPSYPKHVGFVPAMNFGVDWGYSFEDLYSRDLSGQNAIVTGANSGLGYEVSLALAKLGASVTMACRNEERCNKAADSIRQHEGVKGEITPMMLELSSLKSVKTFSEMYLEKNDGAIDMMFLNAGIGGKTPLDADKHLLSEDGIELVFATNVVGHHLLYKLLEQHLLQSNTGRVVLTSSCGSYDTFEYHVATDLQTLNNEKVTVLNGMLLYGQSKLAQILWAKKLTRILGLDSSIYVNSVHPGCVSTPIFDKSPMNWLFRKVVEALRPVLWAAEDAALTLLYLGVATDELREKNIRGKYYIPIAVDGTPPPASFDIELQDKVWSFLDELVKVYAS